MPDEQVSNSRVQDRSGVYTGVLTALTISTAGAALGASLTVDAWLLTFRILTCLFAVGTATVGLCKFCNERAFKAQQEEDKSTLASDLQDERRRTQLLINGALLGTADRLRDLALKDQNA